MYNAQGVTAATAATANHAVTQLWNPHSTQRIRVVSLAYSATAAPGAGSRWKMRRTSARGTAGSTITPSIDSHSERGIAPPSGALVDLAAFSAQPTFSGDNTGFGWVLAAVAASGIVYPFPRGIVIPAGQGLALVTEAAIIVPAGLVTWSWLEDW
jgi:hypothetical protein